MVLVSLVWNAVVVQAVSDRVFWSSAVSCRFCVAHDVRRAEPTQHALFCVASVSTELQICSHLLTSLAQRLTVPSTPEPSDELRTAYRPKPAASRNDWWLAPQPTHRANNGPARRPGTRGIGGETLGFQILH